MKPTLAWTCDHCKETIKTAADGVVEWLSARGENGRQHGYGLRLVHHCTASPRGVRRCDYWHYAGIRKEKVLMHNMQLESFLGPDGLTQLLSLLSQDTLPREDLLRLIMRLHIPGYEQARQDADRAIANEIFVPTLPDGYYWQSDIEAVQKFARNITSCE